MVGIPSEPPGDTDAGERRLHLAAIIIGFIAASLMVLTARYPEEAFVWGGGTALVTLYLCVDYRRRFVEDTQRARLTAILILVTFYAVPFTCAVTCGTSVGYLMAFYPEQFLNGAFAVVMAGVGFVFAWSLYRLRNLWIHGLPG